MDNATLLDGLRRQQPEAARHLYQCLVPSIWRQVCLEVDAATAEDIVAETVLALVDAVAAGQTIDHPAAWLRTVARRRVQDHFRATARVRHLIDAAARDSSTPAASPEPSPPDAHDQKLKRQAVRDTLDRLPEDQRLALEWKYLDDVSVDDIAGRLGRTAKAVESLLFRSRGAFRELLPHVENRGDDRTTPPVASSRSSESSTDPHPEPHPDRPDERALDSPANCPLAFPRS